MIAVIDYDIGNLGSVVKAFNYLDINIELTRDPQSLARAEGIILPGVGAFGAGIHNLRKMGFEDSIKKEVQKGKPFFGICLGMQLLFEKSEENKKVSGLSLIPGSVKKFSAGEVSKIPQIGWNKIELCRKDPVFEGLNGQYFYFIHSYYCDTQLKYQLGRTSYGKREFTSIVNKDNIWGMQCHPEKSSDYGLQVLKNFGEVVGEWK